MLKVIAPLFAAFAVIMPAFTSSSLVTTGNDDLKPAALTVHEWGTFTTVAGSDGQAIDWLPLGGPSDLPCFVEHFDNNVLAKWSPSLGARLSYAEARSRLKGRVRMETPVLYFYSSHEQTLNVKVDFPGGLVTEWYPHASVLQTDVQEKSLTANGMGSRIEWSNVKLLPDGTPRLASDGRASHYYRARETDAVPLKVGGKDEKFLFYRGVGSFPVPLSAEVTPAGKILIKGSEPIPAIVLFENRGGKIGYRIHGQFQGRLTLDLPALDGDFASLQRELEKALTASGLYAREARAMVETWRDSWFEEGTRVLYVLPRQTVDRILPLNISPAPANAVRTFVGRMEVITPATVRAVEHAIAANDGATLTKYVRFLGPIADRMPAKSARIQELVDSTYKSFLGEVSANCR